VRPIAIRVQQLGKEYRIGRREPRRTLRESIAEGVARPFRALGGMLATRGSSASAGDPTYIWALKDVSFEISRGEVVGIIGRNGSGKSTLLKILSRITEPTQGEAEIHGRVASLLEVGTGFHPELTGRENVYLNGAILGMKRTEIARRFDEIVGFAEVETFLDTPVKHYSSGMYLRLAFAVAAHLEPEILLVDEVLAVGDAAFQRKCLDRVGSVAREGRTVLLVSHNAAAVRAICQRGILLQAGRVAFDGPADEALAAYVESFEASRQNPFPDEGQRPGNGRVRLVGVEVSHPGQGTSGSLIAGLPARFEFSLSGTMPGLSCGFTIYDHSGLPVTHFDSTEQSPDDSYRPEIGNKLACELDELALVPGRYRLNVALYGEHELQDHVEGAALFTVEPGMLRGRAVRNDGGYGNVALPHRWSRPRER
jgi:lipopolysaccharide transport system ATP-binding protein